MLPSSTDIFANNTGVRGCWVLGCFKKHILGRGDASAIKQMFFLKGKHWSWTSYLNPILNHFIFSYSFWNADLVFCSILKSCYNLYANGHYRPVTASGQFCAGSRSGDNGEQSLLEPYTCIMDNMLWRMRPRSKDWGPVWWRLGTNRNQEAGRHFLCGFLRTSDDVERFPVRMMNISGI